jgi:PAS domain-containing protein
VVLPEFFRTGACDRVPYQFVRSDGRVLDILLSATVDRDEHGAVTRSLAVLEDVTAQKRLEAELGRTHAHLDAVVDNIPALAGFWDANAVTRIANRDFQAAVGLPIDQIIGRPLAEVLGSVDPRGYEQLAPHVEEVLAGRRRDFECAMLTTSGLRQLRVALVPAQPEAGRIDGFYGTWFDVTGTKALELRQRDSERRHRTLLENMPCGYALSAIEVDAEGRPVDYRIVAVNAAFCALAGLDGGSIVGARATELALQLSANPDDWIARVGRVALGGETLHAQYRSPRSGRWLELLAYRPEPGHFALLVGDISERKRLEDELARLRGAR